MLAGNGLAVVTVEFVKEELADIVVASEEGEYILSWPGLLAVTLDLAENPLGALRLE